MRALKNALKGCLQAIRKAKLQLRGVEVGDSPMLSSGIVARLGVSQKSKSGRITFESKNAISEGVVLNAYGGNIILGHGNHIGPYSLIYGHGDVTIGHDCLIASHCQILSSNHTIPNMDTPVNSQPNILLETKIGNDVWLGAGVIVLGGVTIGDGCVVGAGAVVTKDLPSGSIAVGVPARITGQRNT